MLGVYPGDLATLSERLGCLERGVGLARASGPAWRATRERVEASRFAGRPLSEDNVAFVRALERDGEPPLLCAGAIGYRALRLTGMQEHDNLGLTGFGASAHLVLKMAKHRFPGAKVFVFSRTEGERRFALELGADWAGDLSDEPPERMNSIIDTTPAWTPVVEALKKLEKGGRLVINAIRKEAADKDSLSGLDYSRDLWLEKEIKSVANVARRDVAESAS